MFYRICRKLRVLSFFRNRDCRRRNERGENAADDGRFATAFFLFPLRIIHAESARIRNPFHLFVCGKTADKIHIGIFGANVFFPCFRSFKIEFVFKMNIRPKPE